MLQLPWKIATIRVKVFEIRPRLAQHQYLVTVKPLTNYLKCLKLSGLIYVISIVTILITQRDSENCDK